MQLSCSPWIVLSNQSLQVKQALLSSSSPLIGSMVWMIAHEGYAGDKRDAYTLYPSAQSELNALRDMSTEVNR